MTSLQNLPQNVGDLGKLNVAKGFKKLPKIQKIAKSGHTGRNMGYEMNSSHLLDVTTVVKSFIKSRKINETVECPLQKRV